MRRGNDEAMCAELLISAHHLDNEMLSVSGAADLNRDPVISQDFKSAPGGISSHITRFD
jgi:hypothetical protein